MAHGTAIRTSDGLRRVDSIAMAVEVATLSITTQSGSAVIPEYTETNGFIWWYHPTNDIILAAITWDEPTNTVTWTNDASAPPYAIEMSFFKT